LGIERGLFFVIAMAAVAIFNLFASFLAAVVVFAVGFLSARMATEADPKILTIIARSERLKARYDAMKQEFPRVVVRHV
jgi:type IV secretory pathway TrbD component